MNQNIIFQVWCPNNPDCEDPAKLCDDLTHDYHAFKTLSADFPGRYKVFRYEDFSMDPYNNTKDVFQFFGFTFHNRVKKFLDSHTRKNIGGKQIIIKKAKKDKYADGQAPVNTDETTKTIEAPAASK